MQGTFGAERKNGREKSGVPFIVGLRKYLFHAIIAAIVLVVDILIFEFLAEGTAAACAEVRRVNDAPQTEIIFSGAPNGDDVFYYLNQHHIVGGKNDGVSCDILMTSAQNDYGKNDIYFKGTLEKSTCAVSKNLALKYGLNKGDCALVVGTGKRFKVAELLPAQSGLDKDYLREGIVVLAYDGELLEKQYSYISFATDGDEYISLTELVYIVDWYKPNASKIASYAAISLAAFGVTVAVCELFLFKYRRRDYPVLVAMGCHFKNLFARIFFEHALKYFVPLIVAVVCFTPALACYGSAFALPVLYCAVVRVIVTAIYSLFGVRRLYRCQAKAKRS